MTFPSRGCRTCKQRHVKCDEEQPICRRCQKANLACQSPEEDGGLIILNENKYATGLEKRPRGPNVHLKKVRIGTGKPRAARNKSLNQNGTSVPIYGGVVDEPRDTPMLIALSEPIQDQALCYYTRRFVDSPQGLPEAMGSHLSYVSPSLCYFEPDSTLSLAILAVSKATFGRAQRSSAALTQGRLDYSKALINTNTALQNAREAVQDDVLLAVMLLSFYENSMMYKTIDLSHERIELVAARSFAHHDGAMAMLKMRRTDANRSKSSIQLDKVVRRQLVRSLLLRSKPVPPWLRDGSQFGELPGSAMTKDRCMVIAAKLRHQASGLRENLETSRTSTDTIPDFSDLTHLILEAQHLEGYLAVWAKELLLDDWYKTRLVREVELLRGAERFFGDTVQIYASAGHAGLWDRYRVLRIIVNDIILRALTLMPESEMNVSKASLTLAAQSKIDEMAGEICASVPYTLGLLDPSWHTRVDVFTRLKDGFALKLAVTAANAAMLSWPLSILTMVSHLSEPHMRYLKARLKDIGEIIDDGVLERMAGG